MSVDGYFKTNWRGVGMLRNVAAWMNQVGRFLNGMSIIGGVTSRKNGTITFSVTRQHGGTGGESSPFEYRSYFRVIDASTYDENGTITLCKIGVTNGSSEMLDPVGNCGAVKINGAYAPVEADVKTVTEDGIYYVWIHSWLDASLGPQAEIRLGDAGVSVPPENPNGGLRHGSKLAGRVTVEDGKITDIVQDYLSGGEHTEIMMGNCDGLLIMCGQGGAQT